MADTKFYFAKFTPEGNFYTLLDDYSSDLNREARIKATFEEYLELNEPVVEDEDGDWYCGEYYEQDGNFIGEFGRQFDEESKIYDEEVGKFVESPEPITEADSSQFILDIENRLIVFNTGKRLGHRMFMDYFQRGFNNTAGAGIIKIEPLENQDSLERILKETTVKEAELDLRPTNPAPEDSFEDLDETIQEMLADKLGLEAISEDGLNVSQDLLSQAIKMAESEYGDYSILYDDGNPKVISSGEVEQVTKEEEGEIDNLTAISSIASQLLEYGRSFIDND